MQTSSCCQCDSLDLKQDVLGQPRNLYKRPRRLVVSKEFRIHTIDSRKVVPIPLLVSTPTPSNRQTRSHILDKHGGLDDLVHTAPTSLDDILEVLECLLCLREHVAWYDFLRDRVERDTSTDKHKAIRFDRLAVRPDCRGCVYVG